MRLSITKLFTTAVAAAIPLLSVGEAFAAAVCHTKEGDVVITSTSSCEFRTSGGCTSSCTPLTLTASCSAKCMGQCNGTASADCTGSCNTSCNAECTANPGMFDCEGSCTADCNGHCAGSCNGKNDQGSCVAQCQGSCQSSCHGHCSATPPSADCKARCDSSCSGRCTAEANIDCTGTCQSSCTTDLQGGCMARCSEPKGALFCDGQFIDIADVSDCEFSIMAHAEAQGSASASACSMSPGPSSGLGAGAAIALAGGLAGAIARRRRRALGVTRRLRHHAPRRPLRRGACACPAARAHCDSPILLRVTGMFAHAGTGMFSAQSRCMANTYQQSPPVARGVDVNHAIEQIKRQRMMKMVGALSGFFAVVVMLFGAEAAMLSQEQAPGPMLDPQPGELAPYYAD